MPENKIRSTTILCVRKNGKVAIGGDGQVSMGNTVMKNTAKKIRRLYDGKILSGFAGSAADAFTLFELFEKKVQEFGGSLSRSAVELAREWRTDRMLRRLEALLIVADKEESFLISGTGDVISQTIIRVSRCSCALRSYQSFSQRDSRVFDEDCGGYLYLYKQSYNPRRNSLK